MKKRNKNVYGVIFAAMVAASMTACSGQKTVDETTTVQTEQHEVPQVSSVPVSNVDDIGAQETENLIGMPNPFTDNATLEEAEKNAGFSIEVPEKIHEIAATAFRNMNQELLEVIYYNGEQEVARIRKGNALDDISGVYTEYDDIRNEQIDGREVTMKGQDGQYELAVWKDGNYSYAVLLGEAGVSRDEMAALVKSVK